MDTVHIRPALAADFSAITALLVEAQLLDEDVDGDAEWKKLLAHDAQSILIAETTSLIGVIFIIVNPWFSSVWHLAVKREYRTKGVGTLLLRSAEAEIKRKGCKYVSLYLKADDEHLLRYYEKRGYTRWPALIVNMNKRLEDPLE